MGAIWVGIDVSKRCLDVAVRPTGESFSIDNDDTGIKNLTKTLAKRSPQLIVLEATGGHEYAAAYALMKAGLPVAVVNPRQVRDFARAVGKLAKTDPIDAKILAHFGEAVQPPGASGSRPAVGRDWSSGDTSSTAGSDDRRGAEPTDVVNGDCSAGH
jgi:transposase